MDSQIWNTLHHQEPSLRATFGGHSWRPLATDYRIANGMIERQLKAALKCHQQPDKWTESLLMVLLGVRSALKEDLGCTAAELVYGAPLRLPGEFFTPCPDSASPELNSPLAGQAQLVKN